MQVMIKFLNSTKKKTLKEQIIDLELNKFSSLEDFSKKYKSFQVPRIGIDTDKIEVSAPDFKEYKEEINNYFKENLSYELVITSNMAKLQKYSVIGDKTKGIEDFYSYEEYAILSLTLDFLEDKYNDETILISELLEYIVSNYPVEKDWRERNINLSLIRVLKYCEEKKLLKKLDGSESDFVNEIESEILYENTGFSKYFMNTLPFNIGELDSLEKILGFNFQKFTKDQIVKRQLLENLIVTKEDLYYEYLIENRETLKAYFENLLDMKLVVFKEFSYLIKEEESSNISKGFPSNNNMEKIMVIFLGNLDLNEYTLEQISKEFEKFKFEYTSLFTKGNLNKNNNDFLKETLNYGEKMKLLKKDKEVIRIGDFIKHYEVELLRGDIDE